MASGVSSQYIATSSSIADGAVSEAKLADQACSAAKMKWEGAAGQVLTSNGAGAIPSYQAVGAGTEGGGNVYLAAPFYTDAATGTWANGKDTTAIYYPQIAQGPAAQNNSITFNLGYIRAGTWNIYLTSHKTTDGGIATFLLDGITNLGTLDLYAAGETYDTQQKITGANIAASGFHTMQIKFATKNGASSDYNCKIQIFEMRRTA